MPYHLSKHVYIAQFQEELILLDTKQDRYTIFFPETSQLLIDLLEGIRSTPERICPSNSFLLSPELICIHQLINNNIIEQKDTPYPFFIDRKINSAGVANVDWSLPLEYKNTQINAQVLKALIMLIQVHFSIKFRGLYSTIQLIKHSWKKQVSYVIPQEKELNDLANIVDKACLVYPKRTKCLEWAITFVLLALKRKWRCNLEIGVQNYPFFAHAWVECNGKAVRDSEDLRPGLSIILNEPFRKLKYDLCGSN